MKKLFALILAWAMLVALASCGTNAGHPDSTESGSLNEAGSQDGQGSHEETTPPSEAVPPVNANILIAYFSRVGNTDFPEDVDAVSSASLLRKDGELYGNTQYIASLIQQTTGGDLFLIETEEKYPSVYEQIDEQGGEKHRNGVRPKLARQSSPL